MKKFAGLCLSTPIGALIAISLLTTSCAQVGMPAGGMKDASPPKVVSANPNYGEINIQQNSFSLEFDEYVVPNQIKSELIVSPPFPKSSETAVKGKSLRISFTDSLEKNTTYTVNLRNGVKDLNEGNILDSNIWVFSTGNYLDSGSISGFVFDAFSKNAMKDVWVMLYNNKEDSVPLKEQAVYLSMTNEAGAFKFDFLPLEKEYKLFCLLDENADYLFSAPNEVIAFSPSNIKSGADSIKLYAFKEENPLIYVSDFRQLDSNHIQLVFSEKIHDINVSGIGFDLGAELQEFSFPTDSLFVGLSYDFKPENDSLAVLITINESSSDTFYLRPSYTDTNGRFAFPEIPRRIEMGKQLSLKTKRNLNLKDSSKLFLFNEADSVLLPIYDAGESQFACQLPDSLTGSFSYILGDSVFYIPGSFYSDSSMGAIEIFDASVSPDITVLGITEDNVLLDLLNDKRKLVQRLSRKQNTFKDLPEGKYSLRAIIDDDKNGFWTSGKYIKGIQAEKVYYYPDDINVKNGFDLELNWQPKDSD